MKKFVSLLAVALFATVFAAGCGKHKACSEAGTENECKAEKFETGKFNCEWKADASGTKKCLEKTDPIAEDEKKCKAVQNATAALCTAVTLSAESKAANKKCEFVAGIPAAGTTAATTDHCEFK